MVLSYRETQIVKGMLKRGDRQHDIAAYFGVNGGRIAEVRSGECNYPHAEAMAEADLPPRGPYVTKYALEAVIETLNEAIEALELEEHEKSVEGVKAALELAKETVRQKINAFEEV